MYQNLKNSFLINEKLSLLISSIFDYYAFINIKLNRKKESKKVHKYIQYVILLELHNR